MLLDEENIDQAFELIGQAKDCIEFAIKESDSEEVREALKTAKNNLNEVLVEIKGDRYIKCYICAGWFLKPKEKKEFTDCPNLLCKSLVKVEQ